MGHSTSNVATMKRVFISGASRGIGRACVAEFAAQGYRVAISGRDADILEEMIGSLPGNHHLTLPGDLLDHDVRTSVLDQLKNWGIPDVVVQCLGGFPQVTGRASDIWMDFYHLNVVAPIVLNAGIIEEMKQKRAGVIVHLSSSSATNGKAFAPYASAKAALNRYIIDIGKQLLCDNIHLFGIAPAAVSGNGNYWDKIRLTDPEKYERCKKGQCIGRFQTPDEIASVISAAVRSHPKFYAGTILSLDGNA